MIVVLHSQDPALSPTTPWINPYDFTIPRRFVEPD
jgi:hypothetical protein